MKAPIEFDKRYKVNQDRVDEMRKMRAQGISYQQIASKVQSYLMTELGIICNINVIIK